MKNLFLISCVLLFQTTSSFAFVNCADFSGSWTGKCEGTGSVGPNEFVIEQPSCEAIRLIGTDLKINNEWNEVDGYRYKAFWNSLIPEVSNLNIQATAAVVGVVFVLEYNMSQTHDGMQVITRTGSRTYAGEAEQLETCTFSRLPQ